MLIVLFFDITNAFNIGFSTFPPKLIRIGSAAKKWQLFSKSEMVAVAILVFGYCAIFGILYAFYIGFAACPPNLVRNGKIVMNWPQFFEIQYDGNHHLGF